MVLSLAYLHGLGIVHRDVKPQNILIDATGHVKLTDFGLSKQLPTPPPHPTSHTHRTHSHSPLPDSSSDSSSTSPSSSSSCSPLRQGLLGPSPPSLFSGVGTHQYLAPEIILGTGHDAAVDWWSLGVVTFEMLCGYTPFHSATVEGTYDAIITRSIDWPVQVCAQVGVEAVDLIDRLLCVDVTKRLGAHGAREIQDHPFFQGVQWERLAQQKTEAESMQGKEGASEGQPRGSLPSASTWPLKRTNSGSGDVRLSTPHRVASPVPAMEMTAERGGEEVAAAFSYWGGPSHVPSSRARSATSANHSPSVRDQSSPAATSPLVTPPAEPELPTPQQQQPTAAPASTPVQPPPRVHLLTSLPAWSASPEFSMYGELDSSPEPPAVIDSPALPPAVPSFLTSLAPITTDLSFSSLSSFPSLSGASSSLLSTLSSPSSHPSPLTSSSGPPPSAATLSSLDRLLLLASPAQPKPRMKPSLAASSHPPPPAFTLPLVASHPPVPVDAVELQAEHPDGEGMEEVREEAKGKTRERLPSSAKPRRKASSSAKAASRTLRSPFPSTHSGLVSPPAPRTSILHSPPIAAGRRPARKQPLASPPAAPHPLSPLPVPPSPSGSSSSDAEQADADSEADDSATERRRRRGAAGGVSPSVQGRAMRHYARKSPDMGARKIHRDPPPEGAQPGTAGLGSVREMLEEVVLAPFAADGEGPRVGGKKGEGGMEGGQAGGLVAGEERERSTEDGDWLEARKPVDRRVGRLLLQSEGRGGSGGGGVDAGWSGSEFSSDWSVNSEDEFGGFGWSK